MMFASYSYAFYDLLSFSGQGFFCRVLLWFILPFERNSEISECWYIEVADSLVVLYGLFGRLVTMTNS